MEREELQILLAGSGLDTVKFNSPWAARLFGITLAAARRNVLTLPQFQQALIGQISAFEATGCIADDDQYYTCWLQALQGLLEQQNLVTDAGLHQREHALQEAAEHRHGMQQQGSHQIAPRSIQ